MRSLGNHGTLFLKFRAPETRRGGDWRRSLDGIIETRVNGGLSLLEPERGQRFGTDALLLAAFARGHFGKGRCADFGTGSGILPLLLLSAGSGNDFSAYEIQELYARLASENAERNGFGDRMTVFRGDLREHRTLFPCGAFSSVISNPPYFPAGSGIRSGAPERQIARHAETLTAEDLCAAVSWGLKSGGKFFCVYLPSGTAVLFHALRAAGVEPKRLRPVAPSPGEPPSLILVEAKKNAAPGLIFEKTFFIYEADDSADSSGRRDFSGEMREVFGLFSV